MSAITTKAAGGPTAASIDSSGADASTATGADPTPLLPPPRDSATFGADPVLTIACLMLDQQRRMRETARRDQEAADDRQIAAEEKEAQDLHAEASTIRFEGWTEGACDVASAGLQLGAADKQNADAATFGAAAKVADGMGHSFGAQFRAAAKDDEARQKIDAKQADQEKKLGDEARDMVKEADDASAKVLDFMRAYLDGQHQARAAAMRGVRG